MRILIVDDSAFMRRVLSKLLETEPGFEIVGTASDGREALKLVGELHPDVMTLDIQMPNLNGLQTLEELAKRPRTERPPVLLCSSLTKQGSHEALDGLRLGAADFILKDSVKAAGADGSFREELVRKIRAIGRRRATATGGAGGGDAALKPLARVDPKDAATTLDTIASKTWRTVLIGSSTGGPPVLDTIITAIPADTQISYVIAQHMPELFTRSLAERLDRRASVPVEFVDSDRPLMPGRVYVGVGGRHIRLSGLSGERLQITDKPAEAPYKPSVDELLKSGATARAEQVLGVVLTGMGSDGAEGGAALAARGGTIIAQDEASSVVFGMPRAVLANGSAKLGLSPERIGELFNAIRGGGAALAGGVAERRRSCA